MKQHIKFNRLVMVVAALVMMVMAVAAVSADDSSTAYLPTINDGRVNEYDISAPVAVYDIYAYPDASDVNAGVLDRIEFWGLDGSGTIQKVLQVSKAEIVNATVTSGESVLIATNDGYSLYKQIDGSLTVVAPIDSYAFNWTPSL